MGPSLLRAARLAATASLIAVSPFAAAQPAAAVKPAEYQPQLGQEGKDVVWIPTPDDIVQKMLDLAQVAAGDRVVDLGSGDGKIAIAAARRGAVARGIEYNPDMVELSKRNAKREGVEVDFQRGDIFESKFEDADVVTLYLLPTLNEKLRPTLLQMKPGTRVTSHSFRMGDWKPDETVTLNGRDAHFWRVPARIEGRWEVRVGPNSGPVLRITQKYQELEGQAEWGDRAGPLREPTVRGAQVTFHVTDPAGNVHRFEGVADHGGPIVGTVTPEKGGAPRLFVATRR